MERCLQKAELGEAELEHMATVNEIWMAEYVDQELGGYKLAFAYRAEEAEKHGDFLLGEQLRHVLSNPRRLRVFNILMALLLVGSLYPVVLT